jgi:hypothetical protein
MTLTPLTEYEAKVVAQIATWKAEKTGLYTQLTSRLTKPVASAIQYVIPEVAARKAVEAAYATSDWLANPDEIIKKGRVRSLDELQHKSLELSDRLADQIGSGSMTIAAIDGAVTGAGGFFLAAADVGALAILALRAIHRTGHCYGFPLDQPRDQSWVLGILLVVGTKSAVERLEVLGKLHNVQNWVMAETVEALAMERFSRELVELASLGAVPGIGAFVGTATNLLFIRQVLQAAQHVFQERWLRENSKIESISPAPS